MKKSVLLIVLTSVALFAGSSSFEITDGRMLKVNYGGLPFLLGEKTTPATTLGGMQIVKTSDGAVVYNAFDKKPIFPFRREASVSADQKTLEISFQGMTHAYDALPKVISYGFECDIQDFAGGTWYTVTGRARRPVENKGVLPGKGAPNYARMTRMGAGAARVLILTSADSKKSLVFDFNVEGVTVEADYGPTCVRGLWNVTVQNGILTCSVGLNQGIVGGILNSQIRVYEGNHATWRKNHAYETYAYAVAIPCQGNYSFGAPEQKVGKTFRKITGVYDKKTGAGWLKAVPENAVLAKSGALYTASVGSKPAVFQVSGVKPGIYLVTMRSPAYQKSIGAFSMTVNGQEFAKEVSIPANQVAVIRRMVHLDETSKFELSGNWSLSTLSFQAMVTDFEDLRFRRGFWRANGLWEPTPFLASKHYGKQPEYKTDVELVPLAPHDYKVPANFKLAMKKESCRPADSDQLEWRYNSNITGLGPGNLGSFMEFDTREKVARRMDELKKEGTTTVLVNGLLARHLAPSVAPYVEKAIRMYSEEAHKRGMKLLDHQDYSLLWQLNDGTRVAADKPNLMLHSIVDGSCALGYCVTQEPYLKAYRQEIARQVKERHLDGIMIDEVCFLCGADFCGCGSCRKKFTQDTGLILPMDETSPLLDKKSVFHRAFDQWRIKVVGDWFVELRKEINKVQPNFSIMLYTTHYGWYSDYASIRLGATLEEPARAVDFMGTEIMSRNVIVSRRPVYAFRKMKNALTNLNKTPLFGLVYPQGNYEISEFGWGLNNLANQSTWFISTVPAPADGQASFISFQHPYNRRFCKPAGRIAILWSTRCRDYERHCTYYQEPLGVGEVLNDMGIQYEYILEQNLANLKDYSALLVLNAHNLSDQQIGQIRSFAENGGLVYLSGHAATYNELVEPRTKWPFADVFNGSPKLPVTMTKLKDYSGSLGNLAMEYYNVRFGALSGELNGEVLWSAQNGKYPVVVKAPCGQGFIIYSSIQFGALLLEDEKTVSEPFLGVHCPEVMPIAKKLFADELSAHSALLNKQVPAGLFTGLYVEKKPGQKGRLILHLLNGTGIQDPAVKEKIGALPPKGTWTPLAKPAQFEIVLSEEQLKQVGNLSTAICSAPEYQEVKQAILKPNGKGRWLLTVPAEAITRYAVVVIE